MSAYETILQRQIDWATQSGLPRVDSRGGQRGRPAYLPAIADNLFQPLTEFTAECFRRGDGNEIGDYPHKPAKMRAVHSTSALAVNVFQYLGEVGRADAAVGGQDAAAYRSAVVAFEEKYPVGSGFGIAPNVDVVIKPISSQHPVVAIECKFSEAYRINPSKGLKVKYLNAAELWPELPGLHRLAQALCPEDRRFTFLHAAQLIKHILGLRRMYGRNFRLVYLWYAANGDEGRVHADEAAAFAEIARADGVAFVPMTYQQLIRRLAEELEEEHGEYVEYLTSRYG